MKVCVFCGSSFGAGSVFRQAALDLARCLIEAGHGLVYGGAHVGLMGLIADAMLAGGAEVDGVIPQQLADKEIAHRGLTRLHLVQTMHERKALMADLSDAFIALPGGFGTLDELFEIVTWAQLRIHQKPIGILNVDGYYNHLLKFLDGCVTNRFLRRANRNLIVVESDSSRLLRKMLRKGGPVVGPIVD